MATTLAGAVTIAAWAAVVTLPANLTTERPHSSSAADPGGTGASAIEASSISSAGPLGGVEDSVDLYGNEDPVDLYGNEVTAAVAKYKLDSAGSLYELHSPETELPHLGVPKG